eukprot:7764722-Pyramimonas_sp.AAC.1
MWVLELQRVPRAVAVPVLERAKLERASGEAGNAARVHGVASFPLPRHWPLGSNRDRSYI